MRLKCKQLHSYSPSCLLSSRRPTNCPPDGWWITGSLTLFYDASWRLGHLFQGWESCWGAFILYLDDFFATEGQSRVNYFCQSCDKSVNSLAAIRWRASLLKSLSKGLSREASVESLGEFSSAFQSGLCYFDCVVVHFNYIVPLVLPCKTFVGIQHSN